MTTSLQIHLISPATWVDHVVIAVLDDPYAYGCIAFVLLLLLSGLALWATKVLLNSIAQDEKRIYTANSEILHNPSNETIESKLDFEPTKPSMKKRVLERNIKHTKAYK